MGDQLARIEQLLESLIEEQHHLLGIDPARSGFEKYLSGRRATPEHELSGESAKLLGRLAEEVRRHDEAIKDLHNTLGEEVRYARREAENVSRAFSALWNLTLPWATAESMKLDTSVLPFMRVLWVRTYIGEPSNEDALRLLPNFVKLLREALDSLGLALIQDFTVETGSVFKRWLAQSQEPVTRDALTERLRKVERAVELQALDAPQADVDFKEAQAAALLIEAIPKDVPSVLQIGSLLIISIPGQGLMSRTLSTRELIELERNQDLLKDPSTVLERLAELSRSDEAPPPSELHPA